MRVSGRFHSGRWYRPKSAPVPIQILTKKLCRIWIAISKISGDKSSAMPPKRNGGMTRRIGAKTGSVMRKRAFRIVAKGPGREGGNQLKTMLAKRHSTNSSSRRLMRATNYRSVSVGLARRSRSSCGTVTPVGVSKYTVLPIFSICPPKP